MLAKRIIPCLDVTAGRVVKGVNFVSLRDAGDPVEIARRYDGEGADELTFLDITASSDERDIILHVIEAVAEQVFIPLTVGGGVRKVDDVRRLLNAGADKISINTAAVEYPQLVADASSRYGAQCIVVAIDARRRNVDDPARGWEVYTHGGRKPSGLDAIEWARRVAETAASGHAVYWSRSRARLWRKGQESGHRQRIAEIRLDCDGDVVLYAVEQQGGIACHTGRESCFFRRLEGDVWQVVDPVLKDPELIYRK